jgi:RNA polymerase sigma factor (sigma-70 family)
LSFYAAAQIDRSWPAWQCKATSRYAASARRGATLSGVPDITESMPEDDSQQSAARRFGLLFDAHRRTVLAYVLRRVDDREDAADVLAETFLIAWRRLEDVPRGDGARPWLLGVARRVLANQRRGARRHFGLADRLGRELAGRLATVDEASETDLLVRRALASLSERDREVLMLAAWEGLSPAEIATAIGVSRVTARSRLHRARRRLRAELAATGWDGSAVVRTDRTSTLDLAEEHTR